MHGIAINCSNDLEAFRSIIPCGISDAGVTTISRELGRTVTPSEVKDLVIDELILREADLCEVSEIPGVTEIEVSAQTGRLAVTAEQPIEDAAVIAAVDEAGYTAVRS